MNTERPSLKMMAPTQNASRSLRCLLVFGVFLLAVFRSQAQSFVITNTQFSSPPNLFATSVTYTNYVPGSDPILTQTMGAPFISGGFHFTEWIINGQRAQDALGQAVNPAPLIFTNNLTNVANYLPVNQYTTDPLVPDWYKVQYFNTTAINASANPSGDGFNIGADYMTGYNPLVFNQVVDGGVSRRPSPVVLVIANPDYLQISATSDPPGLYSDFQVLPAGTNYSLPFLYNGNSGYGFIGWFLGATRLDNTNGFTSGPIIVPVTSNTTYVAKFLPVTQDSDGDGLPDWYELYNFNSLNYDGFSNPSGDGFDVAVDLQRGFQPNVFNEVVDGGVSRRSSPVVLVIANPNYVQITAASDPPGLYSDFQVLPAGTNYSLPFLYNGNSGYGFIGWFLGTNRLDNTNGFTSGPIIVPVTSNTTYVAQFLPVTQDSDGDGLPDWYELYNFNSLNYDGFSNPSGDGFDVAADFQRGFQPNVFNEVVDGGVSRRPGPDVSLIPATPDLPVQPQGQTVSPGTDVTLTVQAHGIGPFSYQWRLNGVAIPGATGTNLTFTDAQPTNGGSFSVSVQTPFGVTNSPSVPVQILSPDLALADDFYSAPLFTVNQMIGSGNNAGATEQTGEPNHDGKSGQHSVWMKWQPQTTGIAGFDTLGSGFDTVLAVYTNGALSGPLNIANLAAVTADDDGGAWLTSAAQFNAAAGQTYYIAVDGFGAAAGNIVLSWQLDTTNASLPVILQQPLSYVASFGDTVNFTVVATNGNPLIYQWQVDGAVIPGATNSTLTLQNVQIANVGNYVVLVGNTKFSVQSVPAFLQIDTSGPNGTAQQTPAVYKLGNPSDLGSPQAPNVLFQRTLHDGLGGAPVTGLSGTHYFSTAATPTLASWFTILATNTGVMLVTTEGSAFSNSCTVLTGPANAIAVSQLTAKVEQANNAFDHESSRVSLPVVSNTLYYVEVEGNHGASGLVTLSWVFGYQQTIQLPPAKSILGAAGAVLTATIPAGGSAQWYYDHAPVTGATGATFLPTHPGIYNVDVTASGGGITRDLVYLQVLTNVMSAQITGNTVTIHYGATFTQAMQIDASADLINWTTVQSLPAGHAAGSFTAAVAGSAKFYRFSFP